MYKKEKKEVGRSRKNKISTTPKSVIRKGVCPM